MFFAEEDWRTPKAKGQPKRKKIVTSTPVTQSNKYSCLGIDDSNDVDFLLDELDVGIPKSRSKRRRNISRVWLDEEPHKCKYLHVFASTALRIISLGKQSVYKRDCKYSGNKNNK